MPPESQDSVEIKMAVSREFVGIEVMGGQGISSNYSKKTCTLPQSPTFTGEL